MNFKHRAQQEVMELQQQSEKLIMSAPDAAFRSAIVKRLLEVAACGERLVSAIDGEEDDDEQA